MNRKMVSFSSTLIAVLSLVVTTQVADAQYFAGSSCCGQSAYSSYAPSSTYGYGYSPMSSYGSGSIISASYGGCGTPACDTGCYGTSSYCGSGCGLFGHRLFGRRSYSSYAMGYPSCGPYAGCASYAGYGVSSGCNYGCGSVGILGCRHRARCGYARTSSCCLLSNSYSCIGTTAACCTPAPNMSSCMSCGGYGGYTVQPEYTTSAPAVLNPAPTPTPSAAAKPAPDPAPPEEPKSDSPAPAPAPGT